MMLIGAGESQRCGEKFKAGAVLVSLPISRIPHHRKPDHIKMASDLVRSSGDDLHLCQTLIPLRIIGGPPILGPGFAVSQGQGDLSLVAMATQIAANPNDIAFFDLSAAEHAGKSSGGFRMVTHDHQSGGLPVEAMDEMDLADWCKKPFDLTGQCAVIPVSVALGHETRRLEPDAVVSMVLQAKGRGRRPGKNGWIMVDGQLVLGSDLEGRPSKAARSGLSPAKPDRPCGHGLFDGGFG